MCVDRHAVVFEPVLVMRQFVTIQPCVHVFSLLCVEAGRRSYRLSASGRRSISGALCALPEQGGSAGAFECQLRNRSWREKVTSDARAPLVEEGDEAGGYNGEQRCCAGARRSSGPCGGPAYHRNEAEEGRRDIQRRSARGDTAPKECTPGGGVRIDGPRAEDLSGHVDQGTSLVPQGIGQELRGSEGRPRRHLRLHPRGTLIPARWHGRDGVPTMQGDPNTDGFH